VRGINRYGRASQGVTVMNIREDDRVSAVALIVETEAAAEAAEGALPEDAPIDLLEDVPAPAGEDGAPPPEESPEE
jgi:DNA gyrase subunit A